MFYSVFLNFIYLSFPLLVYYLYLVYSKCLFEKEKQVFLDLSLISSFYLLTRFGNISFNTIFMLGIPLIIALYYKRKITSILLCLASIICLYKLFSINILLLLFTYIFIIIFCVFCKRNFLNRFIIISSLFNIFLLRGFTFNDLLSLILIVVLSSFVFYLIIHYVDKIENMINMYYSLKTITKEKKLYESLFKITHEIKNPLAVCKGYLDMFDCTNVDKSKKYINIIDQEINRTLLLLKDFSDISKIGIDKKTMDINLLLEDVCDQIELAFNSNVEFTRVLPDDEIIIEGDYDRLKQVFINIIKNAKEAINGKGKVILSAKRSKSNYIITIKDNGMGMDKETIQNIGTPFYTTKKNGTGLGVCLSKEIIERHLGTICYTANKNKGTIVKITLPINKTSN